jgi:hypothetical protein
VGKNAKHTTHKERPEQATKQHNKSLVMQAFGHLMNAKGSGLLRFFGQSGDAQNGDKSSLVTALLRRTHTARHFRLLTVVAEYAVCW